MLHVSNLSASYGAIRAVKGITLKVDQGSLCVVLGSNGAGKSTTLRSISGLHRPVEGSITLQGQEISRLPVQKVAWSSPRSPSRKTST
jgi:branched-chain amino acid transport system ATP-binding protein